MAKDEYNRGINQSDESGDAPLPEPTPQPQAEPQPARYVETSQPQYTIPQQNQQAMGLASMITGIGALVFQFMGCCCGLFTCLGFVAGGVAVVLGLVAKKDPAARGFAVAGIIAGAIAMVITLFWIAAMVVLMLVGQHMEPGPVHTVPIFPFPD